jgi:hypothetical protein
MRAIDSRSDLEIPEGLLARLQSFRRRVWRVRLTEALLAGVLGLWGSFAVVFVADRLGDTARWLRTLILVAGLLGLGVWLPWQWHRWVWRTRRLDQVARLLRRTLPRLGDRLLGIVELAQNDIEQQRSRALCRAAMDQVDRETGDQEFDRAVPATRHRDWAWAAAVAGAAVAMVVALAPAAGVNAFARWLMPWRQTPRYTFARLEPLPASLVVPYAEPFRLRAALAEDTAWRPLRGTARYGQQAAVTADRQREAYEFSIRPQQDVADLEVSVGDARAATQVLPKRRPELAQVAARVCLPDYLQYPQDLLLDARGGVLSVIQGSRVGLQATATRELASATLGHAPQAVDGRGIETEPLTIEQPRTLQLNWQDTVGLSPREPFIISVTPHPDEAPTIRCQGLQDQWVVLQDEVLTFRVHARDDVGVKAVGMRWRTAKAAQEPATATETVAPEDGPMEDAGRQDDWDNQLLLVAGGPDQESLQATATFSAREAGMDPQTIELQAFARDYLPGRPPTGSGTYVLHIVSSEDHAIWLTERLAGWYRQAQEVYEQEQRLYQANREFRKFSALELEEPEPRQRMQAQVAAERANARRLSALTSEGVSLIQEAVKNDQFQAATLEQWAQMLQSLQELADHRMPSVAELLSQAATATRPADPDRSAASSQGPSATGPPPVGVQRDPRPRGAAPGDEGRASTEATPLVADIESSFQVPESGAPQGGEGGTATSRGLALPGTSVQGGGATGDAGLGQQTPARDKLEQAIATQEDLLAEFARVAAELQRILENLEGSTFVKRLKAAARRQLEVARDLNGTLQQAFGLEASDLPAAVCDRYEALAEWEEAESDQLYVLQQELEAYYRRVAQAPFQAVYREMEELAAVTRLRDLAHTIRGNRPGQSLAEAEYWADTLDRWAEQLVGPGSDKGDSSGESSGGGLPPALILEVMKILEMEIGLREQTRSAEAARPGLSLEDYRQRTDPLAARQQEVAERVASTRQQIRALPDAGENFGGELNLLANVELVMREVHQLLARPTTGPETVAAETEAIELLLQARRMDPRGGGGSGATPGGGGQGEANGSALAQLGAGSVAEPPVAPRSVNQNTGAAGSTFPAEFRTGLDAYFNALEAARQRTP